MQKRFYAGAAVSITTLTASFAYPAYDWRKGKKKEEILPEKKRQESAWKGWKA